MAVSDCELVDSPAWSRFPSTRYQGSKRKLLGWVQAQLADLAYDRVLDAFSGTGAVSYLFKTLGKEVTCNDLLASNRLIGQALIQNDGRRLAPSALRRVLARDPEVEYDDFVHRTFEGIYFTDCENAWIDVVVQNIGRLRGQANRALAYYGLFQACLVKRPYNLFHRRNLYMRTAKVARSFGNKATWDRSFAEHFERFVAQVNGAVFDGGVPCRVTGYDAQDVPGAFDLVYIDPPYVSGRGVGVDYLGFYHFLEGLADYRAWPDRVDYTSKHRRLMPQPNPWCSPKTNASAFARLFERFADSILVVSYRSDGCPNLEALVGLMKRFKPRVEVVQARAYQYALSKNRRSAEVLLIGR